MLLDENLPKKLKLSFTDSHEVYTVSEMNWQGKKNGELLGLMIINGFEALLTIDQNLQHQQNIEKFPLKLIIFKAVNNKLDTLIPYVERLTDMLENEPEPQKQVIVLSI